jgi:hypothetical protein
MKHFKIYYNDGVYAETITFVNKSRKFISNYLASRIKEYNTNCNKLYHIGFKNIKRAY